MSAAGVTTKGGLKDKFKSAKKNDVNDKKLGQGGAQDKLLAKLARKKVVGEERAGWNPQNSPTFL